MTPKKFFGLTSREVLRTVKQELGEDALIVSNRPIDGGIEVMALAADAFSEDVAPPRSARAAPVRQPEPARHPAAHQDLGMVPQLMRELGDMKALLQRELSGITWSSLKTRSPARADVMQSMMDAGFSATLAREMTSVVPEEATPAQARADVRDEIARRVPLLDCETLVDDGGVYALIGPTGVGKTTTVAKLAARCVLRHGASSVALLTTDSYRIAAHDQLRIYGNILDVPVHAIKDAADLKVTLTELRDKKIILIDTIGMSQRDRLVGEQSALLSGGGPQVQRLLLLNATANSGTLDEVVNGYTTGGVEGCIITKIDEAASVGTALDSAIRHRLPVYYVTNGQRVPEDVYLPSAEQLVHGLLRFENDAAADAGSATFPSLLPIATEGSAHV